MRHLLAQALVFLLLGGLSAQVPQGIGYQGVATDPQGLELTNQPISVRASILSGDVNGEVQWQETHSTSTDDFGLFALTIGEGANTGGGQLASFSDIPWGENTYFLQIEMDASGGNNYILMGVNQMMSVPYALHAESAESAPTDFDSIVNYLLQDLTFLENITNILSDSIANTLAGDSVFISNVTNLNGGGCDFSWPDGLHGEPISMFLSTNINAGLPTYQVPEGKTLYLTQVFQWGFTGHTLSIDGMPILNTLFNYSGSDLSTTLNQPILVGAGQILETDGNPGTGLSGILIDGVVEAFTFEIADPTDIDGYTVPIGKKLIVLNLFASNGSYLKVDGVELFRGNWNATGGTSRHSLSAPLIIGEGQTLCGGALCSWAGTINGYLVDEDYFEGCD